MSNQLVKPFTKVLCQNCLCVRDFTEARHIGEELCECGGDFCGCDFCASGINALRAGKRKAADVGCKSDIDLWNERDGIRATGGAA